MARQQHQCSDKTSDDVLNALQDIPSSVLSSITDNNGSVEQVVVEIGEERNACFIKRSGLLRCFLVLVH